jgi:xanthine dehydrogenase accessory factor
MTCPIGLPGIEGKAPEIIAAAVVAQLLQVALQCVPTGASANAVGASSAGL